MSAHRCAKSREFSTGTTLSAAVCHRKHGGVSFVTAYAGLMDRTVARSGSPLPIMVANRSARRVWLRLSTP